MARKPPIRITRNDKAEYQRLVRNTRAKIRRTLKNYGIDLSSEIDIPSIDDFNTRDEFNKFKEQQRSFTNRSNLNYQFKKNRYGFVASKADILRAERVTNRAIARAKELQSQIREKPFISGDTVQGTVGQQAEQLKYGKYTGITVPSEFDFEAIKTQSQLEQKIEAMENRNRPDYYDEKMSTFLENFLTKLDISFGYLDDDVFDEIETKLKNMSPADFYDMYLIFDAVDIDEYSSENELGLDEMGKLDELNSAIDRYIRDYKDNNDLKNF